MATGRDLHFLASFSTVFVLDFLNVFRFCCVLIDSSIIFYVVILTNFVLFFSVVRMLLSFL